MKFYKDLIIKGNYIAVREDGRWKGWIGYLGKWYGRWKVPERGRVTRGLKEVLRYHTEVPSLEIIVVCGKLPE